MRIEIDVPGYTPQSGIQTDWVDGHRIEFQQDANGESCIRGNAEGLRTLAAHLLTLAQDAVPPGAHIHYDNYGGLEPGSSGLVVVKLGVDNE